MNTSPRSVLAIGAASAMLDPKTLALVRIAALVAVGGAVPSYGAEADAAVSAGATAAEIVDVLLGIVSVVGLPSVVAAAPTLAMALGLRHRRCPGTAGGSVISATRRAGRPSSRCCTASLREETPSFR